MIFISRVTLLILLCIYCFRPTDVHASDGQRKGFVLGTGFGAGFTYIHSKIDLSSNYVIKVGPGIDGRIGYAPSNHLQIYFSFKMSMCYLDRIGEGYSNYFDTMSDDGIKSIFATIFLPFAFFAIPMKESHSLLGLGVTYYLNETAPSYFFEGMIGGSIIPDEFANKTKGGLGFSFGTGYEFNKRWNIKCDFLFGASNRSGGPGYDYIEDSTFGMTLLLSLNCSIFK